MTEPAILPLKRSFPPVVDARTRVLILGSLPGEESLARAQYYANPRNQFWPLLGEVIGADLVTLPYEARLEVLLSAGIGLWDVIASASRKGSLDTALRDHRGNDLASLAAELPALATIAFNGGKAASIGQKQIGDPGGLTLITLPSSSPAYTLGYASKRAEWIKLAAFL